MVKAKRKPEPIAVHKTSLALPEDLWLEAKVYCLKHKLELRRLIAIALYEKLRGTRGGR
jgi:hypothetical protein